MYCDVVGLEIDHLINDVAWITDLNGFAVCTGHTVALRSGCENDKLEVCYVIRLALELEGELGWSEGYDGLG